MRKREKFWKVRQKVKIRINHQTRTVPCGRLFITTRFLYGLRIADPTVMGTTGVSCLRFAVLNMLGATIWTVTIVGADYYFGMTLSALFVDIKCIEEGYSGCGFHSVAMAAQDLLPHTDRPPCVYEA